MQLFYQANVPVNQNLLYTAVETAKNAPTGQLDIQCEETTGYIYNKSFNVNLVNYSEEYDNNQHYSPFFESYIDKQIKWLVKKYFRRVSTVIEVGCGKGCFIKKIAEQLPSCKAYGFDTSYVPSIEEPPSNLQIFREYYNDSYAYLRPDAVVCRHVIEHIHKPIDFLTGIRASMPENALLFLETPDVNWILKNNILFDFFYEHCSYWNKDSLDNALYMSGFERIGYKCQFNGQYMWIVSRAKNKNIINQRQIVNKKIFALCRRFSNIRDKKINVISQMLQTVAQKEKPVFVWGAGAKGVTFVNLFDPQRQYVSALVDINPGKQNKFVGMTAHEVIPPQKINITSGGGIIILNRNYFKEIKKLLLKLGLYKKIKLYLVE